MEANSYEEKVNCSAFYYEQQILKVWEVYLKAKHGDDQVWYWSSHKKARPCINSMFSKEYSMSVIKQACLLVRPSSTSERNYELIRNDKGYSLSIATLATASTYDGEFAYAHVGDIVKAMKQAKKYNASHKNDKAREHVVIFPFNIDECHWALGVLRADI